MSNGVKILLYAAACWLVVIFVVSLTARALGVAV